MTAHPKGIISYSESLARLYHQVAKQDIVYIDAAGSVVLGDRKCYAYEIVIRHRKPGNHPLAVANYFATSNNIPSISYFINLFCHAETVLYRSKWTLPKLVICDGSIALIQSIVPSFFKETFKSYLDRCFIIASGKYTHSLTELPFLHMCGKPLYENCKENCKTKIKSVMLSISTRRV